MLQSMPRERLGRGGSPQSDSVWESREAGWRDQVVMEKSEKKVKPNRSSWTARSSKNKPVVKFEVLLLLRV